MLTTNRRHFLVSSAASAAALSSPALMRSAYAADTIKVGALYSQTGGLSIVEKMLNHALSKVLEPEAMRAPAGPLAGGAATPSTASFRRAA